MSFLTRKYPFPESSHWLWDCVVYGAIVFLMLYLLQPFGFSMYQGNKLLVSLLFGGVTFGSTYVYGRAVKPLFLHITPWCVWHEALSILGLVLLTSICNFLVCAVVFRFPITFSRFLPFLYWTLIIGLFITVFSVGLNYYRYLRNKLEVLLDKTTEAQTDVMVTIRDASVKGNDLQLPINDLLYVEAQRNNVMVCYVKDGQTSTLELHSTLTAVLDDLKAYENIFQCHRSFVVNLNNITSAQGNSNGYQLKLGHCATLVPVSRSYVPKLRSYIA